MSMKNLSAKQVYSIVWRWHFYAGILVMPFVIILAVTGAIYLFKPQIDAYSSAPFRNLIIASPLATADEQVAAALTALPGATLSAYKLPHAATDAATILVNNNNQELNVYIHPATLQVLAIKSAQTPLLHYAHAIHGELLMGTLGSILVELAACWAIVLVISGIYLWWPRKASGLAGVLYPRLSLNGRLFWRDLHSTIGMWLSFCVLFLLISGLPWAYVWGNALNQVRTITGTGALKQDWVIAGSDHHSATARPIAYLNLDTPAPPQMAKRSLQEIVKQAEQLQFAPPVLIRPPRDDASAPAQPWIKQSVRNWTVSATAQNRTLNADAELDPYTGAVLSKNEFSQKHIIDRAIGIGIAAHEGQLFGWANQLLGLLTAVGLVVMSISGFVMWRKRAPSNVLGAPPRLASAQIGVGFMLFIGLAGLLLPVLGLSLIALGLLEWLVLSRMARARKWLGLG